MSSSTSIRFGIILPTQIGSRIIPNQIGWPQQIMTLCHGHVNTDLHSQKSDPDWKKKQYRIPPSCFFRSLVNEHIPKKNQYTT